MINKTKRLLKLIEELLNPDDDYDDKVHNKGLADADYVKPTHAVLRTEASEHLKPYDYVSDKSKAMVAYAGTGYRSMNSFLRHGKRATGPGNLLTDDEYKQHINHFKELTKQPTQHEFYTYRGVDSRHLDASNHGDIIHDKGFTSVSLRPKTATQFSSSHLDEKPSLFRIHIKPGTKGHYVSGHDYTGGEKTPDEAEFVLHPGTKFRVGDSHVDLAGKRFTDLHIHSQED